MIKTESECVDCGLPCVYEACRYFKVTRYYCDCCGEEDILYHFDGQELCLDCIKERLEIVDGSQDY